MKDSPGQLGRGGNPPLPGAGRMPGNHPPVLGAGRQPGASPADGPAMLPAAIAAGADGLAALPAGVLLASTCSPHQVLSERDQLRQQNAELKHRLSLFQQLFRNKERLTSVVRTLGIKVH